MLITFFGEVHFTQATYSRDYTADPNDTTASTYLNFYAKISTALPYPRLKLMLKDAERQMGRTPERKAQGIIDADFDIL